MCASSWQSTIDGRMEAMASAFPAVPVITGKTSRSVSKISRHCFCTRLVISSLPYELMVPAAARAMASRTSGEQPCVLSERKSRICDLLSRMNESDTLTFADLGLDPKLLEALTGLGYEVPTPIQERTIPLLLAGGDLIGQAQTGTGKTAAFALPILQKIDPKSRDTQALVLTPTRELAMQVAEAIHSYAAKMEHVSVLPVYGGAPIVPQLKRLERGAHVVVGTPGRLIDHLDRGSLKLDKIKSDRPR